MMQMMQSERNTTPFITLTDKYAHPIMKQKKTKTGYLYVVFLFCVIISEANSAFNSFLVLEP